MTTSLNEKLIEIYKCIEKSCESSVKLFDSSKGHTNKSAGTTAYEERQKMLLDMSEKQPDVIEFLCKRIGHMYFKFNGGTLKIISSPRDTLVKNVFERNAIERNDEEFGNFDPLHRVIYKTDYDITDHSATILECHYLEIDRNTHQILKEINVAQLVKENDGIITEIITNQIEAIELPLAGFVSKKSKEENATNDNE